MTAKKNKELYIVFGVAAVYFLIFLFLPIGRLMIKSIAADGQISLQNYQAVFMGKGFAKALSNSFSISGVSALTSTLIAFFLSYTIHDTNVKAPYKKFIANAAQLPMLLPTITYGFAIIYSLGKQGLLTKLFGRQLFDIYGFNGLFIGYIIYTLPVAFLLVDNTMQYIDRQYLVVSRLMGDNPRRQFYMTIFRPMAGTLVSAFIQTFFLCFTDFGIPASVGGKFNTVAGVLYQQMLGSVPDFGKGAVVALVMLVPSVVSIAVLRKLEKYNIRYAKISTVEIKKGKLRDGVCYAGSFMILAAVLSMFAVIFVVPFVKDWPYQTGFTLDHIATVFVNSELSNVLVNSLKVALLTAAIGTASAYGCALLTARSSVNKRLKGIIEGIALVTNTIPGMVLGLAFLFSFSGSFLQGTLAIIVICNVVHYFSTPYLMMKNSLSKMNASWETTAKLMGDSWTKTVIRVVTPNAFSTLLEVFGYYFVNSMVTISAVIFIAGARTMVITTKIKELQYYNKFNDVFVLSLVILCINVVGKGVIGLLANKRKMKGKRMIKKKVIKKAAACMLAITCAAGTLAGCQGSKEDQIVIYSNADDEAVTAMKNALDNNGYQGQYIFQTFGTSELGGKLLAEGTNIEADLVTMSTFYVESAQEEKKMFQDLTFPVNTIDAFEAYCAPITAQEGCIIINTEMMAENDLPRPASIQDLSKPEYKDMISVTDITSSSTAWLLIQGLISAYGEDGAKEALTAIYQNAGPQIEESGSGPLKKVRAGEAAIGFGLRQQVVADKKAGLPIDYIDPAEGNFSLTESAAVVNKGDKTNPKAMEMAECIMKNAREELLKSYPIPLYEGEPEDSENASGNPKVFEEKLTVDLLKKHQSLSEECK